MNIKQTIKIRICPFCGHHGQEIVYSTYDGLHKEDEGSPCEKVVRKLYQVECKCCGAKGPVEYEPRCAIESWNHIYSKPAHNDDPKEIDFEYFEETERKD